MNIYGLYCLTFQVEFPPLAAYRLEFGEPELDPEEVLKDGLVSKETEWCCIGGEVKY